jgi:hypothetical protein
VRPVNSEEETESFQRRFRATERVRSPLIGLVYAFGHSASLKLKSIVATDWTRPVTSTGASGQYEKY